MTYNNFQAPDTAATEQNIVNFSNKLKEKMNNNFKVCMKLGGYDYQQYKNITGIQIVQYQYSIKKTKITHKII